MFDPAGLYLAPQMVGEAMKGGQLIAYIFSARGYKVHPISDKFLPSFITAVELGSPEAMQAFCTAVQTASPVGSYVLPVPGLIFLIHGYNLCSPLLNLLVWYRRSEAYRDRIASKSCLGTKWHSDVWQLQSGVPTLYKIVLAAPFKFHPALYVLQIILLCADCELSTP